MKKIIYLVVLAHSFADAQVYKGTIGKYPITFEYMQDTYHWYKARYFYNKVKQDIFLYAEEKDSLTLETNGNEKELNEVFKIKFVSGSKKITGTWKMKDKSLPINLSLVDTSKITSTFIDNKRVQELKQENVYAFLKLVNLVLTKTKTAVWDENTTLDWYKDDLTKTEVFRINKSKFISNTGRINRELEEIQVNEIVAFHTCMAGAPGGGDYSFSCSLQYLSKELLSMRCMAGYYCGGAHPDFGGWGITYDLSTMKVLELKDLYELNNDTGSFTENWYNLLHEEYPDTYPTVEEIQKINDEGINDCVYTPDVWSEYSWFLTKNGLFCSAYFPRVMRPCDLYEGDPAIPFKKLEKFRASGNNFKF